MQLRAWQRAALKLWKENNFRGVVSVVTGGGKTIFALACIQTLRPQTVLVVVPTRSLLDQWWEECASFFNLQLDDVHVLTGRSRVRTGTINLCILNTAAKVLSGVSVPECMLIVDECHRSASMKFREIFSTRCAYSLGLSATPERPYDTWFHDVVVPALGPVIFEYTYRDALADEVIVPFTLRNVVFDLEPERQKEYDALTRKIARSIQRNGPEDSITISLLLKRSRILNLSLNRISLAVRLVARHKRERILVFHEDIEACDLIAEILRKNAVEAAVYHSALKLRERAETLAAYRHGQLRVLITCRALDEGFNVPETQIGIIAASTATRRQRIQRLGRVLRPAKDKDAATVYTLVATTSEIARLKVEEQELEGVAAVAWAKA